MQSEALCQIIQQRQNIYAFLKGVYEKELPKEFLAEMPEKMKPLLGIAKAFPNAETKKVVKELVQFTDTIPSQDLDDLEIRLAADYARLFLSISKVPPHPSESIYREGTMMQYSRDEVLRTYWSFGVDKKKEFTEPEDHIAVELNFLMHLCEKATEALKNGNAKEARRYIQGQKDFLERHLVKWVPKLVKDILKTGKTPFYKAIAVLTKEYLEMDLSVTKDLLEQLMG